ncbi:MAG: copper resistance protein CopC [Longimicrobiales bacterium]|nr:copper resistance protein CopC [Longimicrobiales bacterium]
MKNALRATALGIALVGALSAATRTSPSLHFALSKSSPEADATVEAPSEIRLWFTQEPQEGTTSIRLVEAEDAGVHVMEAVQDTDDPTSFYVELHGTLPAGTYTVSWRGMGQDGHVVRDSFKFSVAAR